MELYGICCGLVTGLVSFTIWTLHIFGTKPRRFYTLWLGVPALGLGILVCLSLATSFYQSLPDVVFWDIAGFAPTPDVEFVDSRRSSTKSHDDLYLAFCANEQTIKKILAGGFTPIRPTDFDRYDGTPKWWNPPNGENVRVYATDTDQPDFRSRDRRYFASYKLLIYAPESGDAQRRMVYLRFRR